MALLNTSMPAAEMEGPANISDSSNHIADLVEIQHFQFYAWGIVGNIITVLGLVGNVLSMIVLSNRRMLSSTSCYLIALAFFDSIVLISMMLFLALPTISPVTGRLKDYSRAYPYMHPFAYPTALIAQTSTIYITVAFTIERYIAVCRPLHASKMCTVSRAKKAIIIVFILAFVYNLPRMLESQVVEEFDSDTNTTYPLLKYTELGSNPFFRQIYFIYLNMFVMFLIPFLILAVFNVLLVKAVQESRKARAQMNARTARENNLTIMLIVVILVFLLCQLPSIADNIFLAILEQEELYSVNYVKFTCISNLMVVINSATNFYLYCVFGRKFRKVFLKVFCHCLERKVSRTYDHTSLLLSNRSKKQNSVNSPHIDKKNHFGHNGHTQYDEIPMTCR